MHLDDPIYPTFEKLLSLVAPKIQKGSTHMRETIGPEERLCVTLRYLATGDAQVTLAASYRISPAVVSLSRKQQLRCGMFY